MRRNLIFIIISILLLGCLVGFTYERFVPNSTLKSEIFELDVGLKDYKEIASMVSEELYAFEYLFETSEGQKYNIKLVDITENFTERDIYNYIKQEGKSFFNTNLELKLNDFIAFSDVKLKTIFEMLNADTRKYGIKEAINSEIVFRDGHYLITDSVSSNLLDLTRIDTLKSVLKGYNNVVDLNELNCYVVADITSENLILKENLSIYSDYSNINLVYTVETDKVKIDVNNYNLWLIPNYINDFEIDKNNPFTVDADKVKEFVVTLSDKYDTVIQSRNFKTSTNEEVELKKGNYGWVINNRAIEEDIIDHILQKKSEEKEIIYKQKADIFGESDIGSSYIEISIDNQRLWMYKNGELLVNTPIVTGSVSAGHDTPRGVYKLTYKTRNAVLRGPGYASPVSYWMPFNGGIGMHDATWRSNFGGSIYKTNGSHGCINIPKKNAKIIYENITNTIPIILW